MHPYINPPAYPTPNDLPKSHHIPSRFYQSPHPSSAFFSAAGPVFLTALVPIPLGLLDAPIPTPIPPVPCVLALVSAAPANSSQKSFFSLLGPAGAAPNESQKSFFSGSTRLFVSPGPEPEPDCWCWDCCGLRYSPRPSLPSTKRVKVVLAWVTPCWRPWPRRPAVLRAWEARSASASYTFGISASIPLTWIRKGGKRHTFCIPGFTQPSYPVFPTLLTLAPNHPKLFVSAATGSL